MWYTRGSEKHVLPPLVLHKYAIAVTTTASTLVVVIAAVVVVRPSDSLGYVQTSFGTAVAVIIAIMVVSH